MYKVTEVMRKTQRRDLSGLTAVSDLARAGYVSKQGVVFGGGCTFIMEVIEFQTKNS